MPKFLAVETIHSQVVHTMRVGTTGTPLKNADIGKAVKLIAESNVGLCAAGDAIEGYLSSSNIERQGTVDGFAIGGVIEKGRKAVTFDGLQATPGTGAVAIGDYVVVGTVVAANTALTAPLKVTKATTQADAKAAPFKARVISLGEAGTGAVGTVGLIELL
jgi:hypothetical protein